MTDTTLRPALRARFGQRVPGSRVGLFIMIVLIVIVGTWVLLPISLIFLNSFNLAPAGQIPQYSIAKWELAFTQPYLFQALWNTIYVWFLYTSISLPVSIGVAWLLGRCNIPRAHWLEFGFWLSFFFPSLTTTLGWLLLLDPDTGFLNQLLTFLPFVDKGPFNAFSLPGIVWAHLMGNAISIKVMLLTPAFRNMDLALEEAARVSGASKVGALFRVTLPVMIPPIVVVFMLNLIRVFQSFETELLLGTPFGFFNYASMIFRMVRMIQPADLGAASAMGSITLIVIAIVIPLQRWLTQRRRYQTVTGRMRTGLIDLGRARYPIFVAILFLVALLTIIPLFTMVAATFMVRAGFWYTTPLFTTEHWISLFGDTLFWDGLKTTLILGLSTGLLSPFLFSIMGYVLARTQWRGRVALDSIIWTSSAVPGMLSGLGLMWMFLGVPFLRSLYGTIVPLIMVVVLGGKLIGVQLSKAVFFQMGQDLEEAARVSGAGWFRAYVRIWIPLLAPTLALLGVINFVMAAGTTSSIILLTAGKTTTLSILALEWARDGLLEVASAYNLIIVLLTVGVALVARTFGLRVGMTHSL